MPCVEFCTPDWWEWNHSPGAPRTVSSNPFQVSLSLYVVFLHGGTDQYSDEDSRRTLYWSHSLPLSVFILFSLHLSHCPLTPPLSPPSFPPLCLVFSPLWTLAACGLPRFPALIYPTPCREELCRISLRSPPHLPCEVWILSLSSTGTSSRATVGSFSDKKMLDVFHYFRCLMSC